MKINVEETRTGRPCVWEEGGGRTRSGHAVLVTDSKGEPLKPLYVQGKGIRVCSKHALMPLIEGGYVIAVEYKGPQGLLEVYQAVLCEESPGLELQLVQSVDGLQDPPQGIHQDSPDSTAATGVGAVLKDWTANPNAIAMAIGRIATNAIPMNFFIVFPLSFYCAYSCHAGTPGLTAIGLWYVSITQKPHCFRGRMWPNGSGISSPSSRPR